MILVKDYTKTSSIILTPMSNKDRSLLIRNKTKVSQEAADRISLILDDFIEDYMNGIITIVNNEEGLTVYGKQDYTSLRFLVTNYKLNHSLEVVHEIVNSLICMGLAIHPSDLQSYLGKLELRRQEENDDVTMKLLLIAASTSN